MTVVTQHRSAEAAAGDLLSVVYASTATVAFSEIDLALLLAVSRRNNERRDLTGLLLHRDGQFMQALEGPGTAVRAALATIAADPRHSGVWVLDEAPLAERRFGSWAMGYRPLSTDEAEGAPAWFGSPEAAGTTIASKAGQLLDWFRAR